MHKLVFSLIVSLVLQYEAAAQTSAPSPAEWGELMARHQQLMRAGRYAEAMPIIEQAAKVSEEFAASDYRRLDSMGQLAITLDSAGRYADAEKIYTDLLTKIRERTGDELQTTGILRSIGRIHVIRRRFKDAQTFYEQALLIEERVLPIDDPARVPGLVGMAEFYTSLGRNNDARPYAERAVDIVRSVRGNTLLHASALRALGVVYVGLRLYDEAQPLFEGVLEITEKAFGADHVRTADDIESIAVIYLSKGNKIEAGKLFRRVLNINERALGPDHPKIAANVNNVAVTLDREKDTAEIETLLKRALSITEKQYGSDSPNMALPLRGLAAFLMSAKKPKEAETYYRRAVELEQKEPQARNSAMAMGTLTSLAANLVEQKRAAEAEPFARRALEIAENNMGANGIDVIAPLLLLARIHSELSKHSEAIALAQRATQITENAPDGLDHGRTTLGLARAFAAAKYMDKAEPLYLKAIRIFEDKNRNELVAPALRSYAELLEAGDRKSEAVPLRERADKLVPPKQ